MNVSSVKNLNGETFSAVQDADLTTVVQTNSGEWDRISALSRYSADKWNILTNTTNTRVFAGTSSFSDLNYKAFLGVYRKSAVSNPDRYCIFGDAAIYLYNPDRAATVQSIRPDTIAQWNNYSSAKLDTSAFSSVSSNWNDISAYQNASGTYLQEVSHDNTLSGNGTSASPLGLNETVLWEGDKIGTGTITLSEGVNNFERLVVYIGSEAVDLTAPQPYEAIVEFGEYSSGQSRFVLRYGGVISKSLVAPENHIYVWGGELVVYNTSYTTLNVGRTNRVHVSSITTDVIDHSDLTHIYKVIGINRKENA